MRRKALLYLVISVHMIVVLTNMASLVLLFTLPAYFYAVYPSFISACIGWMIQIGLQSFLVNLSVANSCPMTQLENYLRRKAQLPEIDGFLTHYFGIPISDYRKTL